MKNDLFGDKHLEKKTLDEHCSCCGHKTRIYHAIFGVGLFFDFQWFLNNKKGDIVVIPEGYRYNSSWLSYFGLVEQVVNSDGKKKKNTWRITSHGLTFADGKEKVPKEIWRYEDENFESDELISYSQAFSIPQNDLRSDYEIASEDIKRSYCEKLVERYKKDK